MKKILLIVEDEAAQLGSLTDRFEFLGYLVLPYRSGRKAVEDVRQGIKYDLALVDLSLDVGGDYVVQEFRTGHRITFHDGSGGNIDFNHLVNVGYKKMMIHHDASVHHSKF